MNVEVFTPAVSMYIETFVPQSTGFAEVFVAGGPRGVQGPPATIVVGETPTGLINGTNVDFTTANDFDSLMVYLGGIRQREGEDYTITGSNGFQFLTPPLTGMILQVDYVPTV